MCVWVSECVCVYASFVHFIMKISHQMTEWIQTGVFSFSFGCWVAFGLNLYACLSIHVLECRLWIGNAQTHREIMWFGVGCLQSHGLRTNHTNSHILTEHNICRMHIHTYSHCLRAAFFSLSSCTSSSSSSREYFRVAKYFERERRRVKVVFVFLTTYLNMRRLWKSFLSTRNEVKRNIIHTPFSGCS